jgi:hypothetical protein
MEDISRELGREIALSRPAPFKRDLRKKILIIDDLGEVKSGGWLKISLYSLLVISLVCMVTTLVLFIHFSSLSKENQTLIEQLSNAENKIDYLTDEKEVLMARLVISGKKPILNSEDEGSPNTDKNGKTPSAMATAPEELKKEVVEKTNQKQHKPTQALVNMGVTSQSSGLDEQASNDSVDVIQKGDLKSVLNTEATTPSFKIVTIEKFSVKKDFGNNDLIIRFDIRNISGLPGNVTGRIFAVLKQENGGEKGWLVVPNADLKNGVPLQSKKGQPFSIAHFKPVKFKIKNHPNPNVFKKASIFIFNQEAGLIFKKQINITDAE